MKKMLKRRSGFTLVELLIVIIIIGILAGAMLLVAGSGTDSAEATKIISDLRSLKSAALLYYADHPTTPDPAPTIAQLSNYMDRELDGNIYSTSLASGDTWWVGRINLSAEGVQKKLSERAKDVGLFDGAGSTTEYPATGENAWMRAR